LVGIDNA